MKVAQSQPKSYVDNRHRQLEFEVGDKVFLRIAPTKGVMRVGKNGKLALGISDPLRSLIRLAQWLIGSHCRRHFRGVHNVFNVSMLRKYILDPTHVIDYEPLQIQVNLTYAEEPVR
ncbi:hypothetical protein F2P56_018846, partial [Juglans regia]